MKKFIKKPAEAKARSGLLAITWDRGAGALAEGGASGRYLASKRSVPKPKHPVSQKRNAVPRIPARIGPPMTPMANAAPMGIPKKAIAVDRRWGSMKSATVANATETMAPQP